MSILTEQQKQQFIDDGYIVVSGLISPEIVASTRDNICTALGITLDDPATWPERKIVASLETIDLTTPCFTSAITDIARELVGDVVWSEYSISPMREDLGHSPYIEGFIPVLVFPGEGPKKFEAAWPGGFHVDGMQFASLWPHKMMLVALAYLTDTTEYGGATAVIPGSHRRTFEYWIKEGKTSPHPKELMAGIEDPQPIAMPAKAGDIIFMHHLLAHSGTSNRDDHVRIALNSNLTSVPDCKYERKIGAPQADWSPLDWTLRTDNI